MTDLGKLCERVYAKIEWQRFPATFSDADKEKMILDAVINAIEDLFVVTGRTLEYYDYSYIYDEPEPQEDGGETGEEEQDEDVPVPSYFSYELLLDEELYVICAAEIEIFDKVRAQYNDLLGYTTNALTVTNADKPYSYITGTISELEDRKKLYYYKMIRFSHLG